MQINTLKVSLSNNEGAVGSGVGTCGCVRRCCPRCGGEIGFPLQCQLCVAKSLLRQLTSNKVLAWVMPIEC